jgi:hypothetical protein
MPMGSPSEAGRTLPAQNPARQAMPGAPRCPTVNRNGAGNVRARPCGCRSVPPNPGLPPVPPDCGAGRARCRSDGTAASTPDAEGPGARPAGRSGQGGPGQGGLRCPRGANHAPARRQVPGFGPCRIAGNPFSCRQLGRVKVPVVHSRRTPVSSDRHFFSNGVLTGRKGLAYNPPIDAAPRFTGSTPRPLNFSPSCDGIRLLVQPEGSFSRPCCTRVGAEIRFRFFDN